MPPTSRQERPPGHAALMANAKRPGNEATKLDIFLRLRGLEAYADALYEMGARTVNDLTYLQDEDFEALGLDRAAVRVLVQ